MSERAPREVVSSSARRVAQQASISATGDRFAQLMKERGVSVADLAAAVRLQRSTLENFRAGHRSLPGDVLEALANELGTSADFLMDRSADPRPVAQIREEARLRHEAMFGAIPRDDDRGSKNGRATSNGS